jgi:succinate dehydrogenase hydrophobic anchor subunit
MPMNELMESIQSCKSRSRRLIDRWWLTTWMSAVLVLLLYAWFATVCTTLREVYKGFSALPSFLRFCIEYGPITFPLFGIAGSTGLVVARRTNHRQLQALLFLILILALLWSVYVLLQPTHFVTSAT